MSEVTTIINILVDSLEKKVLYLNELLEYCNEQTKILNETEMDLKLFENLIRNKQMRIDQLNALDDGFESVYLRIKSPLSNNRELYAEQIIIMQELIKKSVDLAIEVQTVEARNRNLFEERRKNEKKVMKKFRNHRNVVNLYQKNKNSGKSVEESYFFDTKN